LGFLPDSSNPTLKNGTSNLVVISPVGYFDMLELLRHTQVVLTDSGGLQKEAYFFKKLCITLRDETEWIELVQTGVNALVGADRDNIVCAFKNATKAPRAFIDNLYGNGFASDNIIKLIMDHQGKLEMQPGIKIDIQGSVN
jgi:UDP-GlcNAc3NAcA epimerase